MKPKLLIFLLSVSILLTTLSLDAKPIDNIVVLSGQLKGFSNAIEIEDLSELQYIAPPSAERIIVPDRTGQFNISFHISSPSYYRLGRNILYLSPGDNITVFINYANPQDAVFKGTGALANTYLKATPFPKMGSYLNGEYDVTSKIDEKINGILQLADTRRNQLKALANVPAEFKRLETARIKADVINSLQDITWPEKTDSIKVISDKKIIRSKINELSAGFIDASLMKLVVYRDIADGLIRQPNKGRYIDITPIKDWYLVSDLVDSMRNVSNKQQLILFNDKISSVNTLPYKKAALQVLTKLLAFGKGDMAANFEAVDINGKNVKLSDLKGKLIYVDIWATWCGPCMDEMPSLKNLKTRYKDNPNIAIISLSIDNDDIAWKKAVKKYNFNGYQWRINRTKLQAYNIVSIPRMVLIDKDFKIISLNASLPSDKDLPDQINEQFK